MENEDLNQRITGIESNIEYTQKLFELFQQNINNNITWFYMLVTIAVAILSIVLVFWVRQAVSSGIERGIKKTYDSIDELIEGKKDFLHAYGTASISSELGNLVEVYGLKDFNKFNFVSLTIVNRHGRICDYHSLDIKKDGFSLKIVDYVAKRDGVQLYWNVVWMNNTTYADMLKGSKYE